MTAPELRWPGPAMKAEEKAVPLLALDLDLIEGALDLAARLRSRAAVEARFHVIG